MWDNIEQWPGQGRVSYCPFPGRLHTSCIFSRTWRHFRQVEGYNKRILEEAWQITLIPGPSLYHTFPLSLLFFKLTTLGRNLAFPFSQGSGYYTHQLRPQITGRKVLLAARPYLIPSWFLEALVSEQISLPWKIYKAFNQYNL